MDVQRYVISQSGQPRPTIVARVNSEIWRNSVASRRIAIQPEECDHHYARYSSSTIALTFTSLRSLRRTVTSQGQAQSSFCPSASKLSKNRCQFSFQPPNSGTIVGYLCNYPRSRNVGRDASLFVACISEWPGHDEMMSLFCPCDDHRAMASKVLL